VLPDLRATILGPPADWGEEKLRVPAFVCLPSERQGAGVSFVASAALHALHRSLPSIGTAELPPDADRVFQSRFRALPAGGSYPAHAEPGLLACPERAPWRLRAQPLARKKPRGLRQGAEEPSAKGFIRKLVLQVRPGFRTTLNSTRETHRRRFADDESTLFALLVRFQNATAAGAGRSKRPYTTGTFSKKAAITTPQSHCKSRVPARPSPSPSIADNTPKVAVPSLPLPSAWSLVSHGAGSEEAENPAHETQSVSGADVAVLSIASRCHDRSNWWRFLRSISRVCPRPSAIGIAAGAAAQRAADCAGGQFGLPPITQRGIALCLQAKAVREELPPGKTSISRPELKAKASRSNRRLAQARQARRECLGPGRAWLRSWICQAAPSRSSSRPQGPST